jgi:hypothetical protein
VTNAFIAPTREEPVAKSVSEPPASVPEKHATASTSAEKTAAAGEPFVNETMAQLYLQQGYKQLALKVYRQLAESRPHDASLRSRIAEIEAEDAAAHPDEVAARKQGTSERPADRPFPRSPQIESPTPAPSPDSRETPGFDEASVDSPPAPGPSRRRESVESPVREEPRAEQIEVGTIDDGNSHSPVSPSSQARNLATSSSDSCACGTRGFTRGVGIGGVGGVRDAPDAPLKAPASREAARASDALTVAPANTVSRVALGGAAPSGIFDSAG